MWPKSLNFGRTVSNVQSSVCVSLTCACCFLSFVACPAAGWLRSPQWFSNIIMPFKPSLRPNTLGLHVLPRVLLPGLAKRTVTVPSWLLPGRRSVWVATTLRFEVARDGPQTANGFKTTPKPHQTFCKIRCFWEHPTTLIKNDFCVAQTSSKPLFLIIYDMISALH